MFAEIRRIDRTFAGLAIDLPKECQGASALANAALTATNSPAVQDLHDAILAGTITPKNIAAKLTDSAIALMAAERIINAAEGTQSAINTLYYGALKAHADQLVTALRPAFDEAAAVIQTAGKDSAPTPTSATSSRQAWKRWRHGTTSPPLRSH